MTDTITIDKTDYIVHENNDPDCPISLTRIYKTGERRTRFIGMVQVVQVKQADGSWLNLE